jgi:hypothetical protein
VRELRLSGGEYRSLPSSIDRFVNLEILSIHQHGLKELPGAIGRLQNLR